MPKTSPKTDKGQSQKFEDAARAIGCDEVEAAFDALLKEIGNAQALKKPEKPKKKKRS